MNKLMSTCDYDEEKGKKRNSIETSTQSASRVSYVISDESNNSAAELKMLVYITLVVNN